MRKTLSQLVDEVCDVVKRVQIDMYQSRIRCSYHAARISPDGEVYRVIEASRCCSEREYYGQVPHILTAWEDSRVGNWNGGENETPLDHEGNWVGDEEPVCESDRVEIESKIAEWAKAGNYALETELA